MRISYKEILLKAWQITIKNRLLWIFGFFASFISLEAVYEIFLSQFNQAKRLDQLQSEILNLYENKIQNLDLHLYFINQLTNNFWFYLIFILMLTALALFIWLVFISQIFVIKSTATLYRGLKSNTNSVLTHSLNKFWPVLGINVLSKLILYAGFIGLSLPLLYALLTQNKSAIIVSNLFLFLLYTIFAVAISFMTAYATNFIVLRELHIFDAIKAGWKLFTRNITLSLEIAFILFALKVLSIVISFSLFGLLLIPLVILLLICLNNFYILGTIFCITGIILAFTLICALVNSIYTVFYLSTWSITFIKLSEENLFTKFLNYLKNIPELLRSKKTDVDKFKKGAEQFAVKTEKEARVLGKILEDKYVVYEPKVKKQGKKILKQLKTSYIKYQPLVKKELKKIIAEQKKARTTTQTKPQAKSRSKSKKTKTTKTKKSK